MIQANKPFYRKLFELSGRPQSSEIFLAEIISIAAVDLKLLVTCFKRVREILNTITILFDVNILFFISSDGGVDWMYILNYIAIMNKYIHCWFTRDWLATTIVGLLSNTNFSFPRIWLFSKWPDGWDLITATNDNSSSGMYYLPYTELATSESISAQQWTWDLGDITTVCTFASQMYLSLFLILFGPTL